MKCPECGITGPRNVGCRDGGHTWIGAQPHCINARKGHGMSEPIEVQAQVIEPEKKSRHYKWWFVALGVLVTLAGVACITWPAISLAVVAAVAGICFLASGITRITTFFDLGSALLGASSLFMGILDVIVGIMFLIHPLIGGITIAMLGGIAVIVTGVSDVVSSLRMKRVIGMGPMVLEIIGAIVTVICGVLILMAPRLFIIYLGIMLIIRGVMAVISAFMVSAFIKDLKNDPLLK